MKVLNDTSHLVFSFEGVSSHPIGAESASDDAYESKGSRGDDGIVAVAWLESRRPADAGKCILNRP
jgi:hypothetical protein